MIERKIEDKAVETNTEQQEQAIEAVPVKNESGPTKPPLPPLDTA